MGDKPLTAKERVLHRIDFLHKVRLINKSEVPKQIKLFIHGVIPVLIIKNEGEVVQSLVSNYPSLSVPQKAGKVVIFQDGKLMQNFVIDCMSLAYNDTLDMIVLDYDKEHVGELLGYPPSACKIHRENLISRLKCGLEVYDTHLLDYYGFKFRTTKDLVQENVNWLLEHMPLPEELQTNIVFHVESLEGSKPIPYEELEKTVKEVE
ncbi:hypothetical protein COF68_04500 [Bacillus toyonensis]|uniref:hypothetical protein n=1 Tax=Bacillus toyonensis TaxID=155322 RepID=UPI000BFDE44F|nr:hypothetical protein [Bacillus toyonensis]PHE64115.1 hypothetical protein COF68_04500 [Bacillus toyonensis]